MSLHFSTTATDVPCSLGCRVLLEVRPRISWASCSLVFPSVLMPRLLAAIITGSVLVGPTAGEAVAGGELDGEVVVGMVVAC